jgi:hypothetical protein
VLSIESLRFANESEKLSNSTFLNLFDEIANIIFLYNASLLSNKNELTATQAPSTSFQLNKCPFAPNLLAARGNTSLPKPISKNNLLSKFSTSNICFGDFSAS